MKKSSNSLGKHLLVEYYECEPKILNDVNKIREYMMEAARVGGATIVNDVFHTFNPYGVSGVVVIAESHLAIHTWPEYNFAAVDLFTCGEDVDPWKAFEYLKKNLKSKYHLTMEVKRGVLNQVTRNIAFKPEQCKMEQKVEKKIKVQAA